MNIDLVRFSSEIVDFLNCETLKKIDYGILDLNGISDVELKGVFCFLEELLTAELQMNYFDNDTGIFRVHLTDGFWCYKEGKHVIRADTLNGLKSQVICENRIWYVFDEDLAKRFALNKI